MTYDIEKRKAGREPITIVELELDSCSLVYGTSPCTASGSAGSECYNTYETCQDRANYAKTQSTYRFCNNQQIPVGINAIPCVSKVNTAPTKITAGKGLGYRANVTVDLIDFPHDDIGIDPYVSTRNSPASGTFFGKLYARNPFYQARTLRVKSGYVADTFDESTDFITKTYIIEKFVRNSSNGMVQIVGKDPLKLADKERAQCPVASSGSLASAITDSDTSLTLTAGTGTEYGSSGHVRIDDEIMSFASRSTDTLNGITRAQYNTTAKAHDADSSVQLCKEFSNVNVTDIIYDLLVNFANIDSSFIDTVAWDAEEDKWLSASNLSTIISEPEGAQVLINELCTQLGIDLWWDERTQLIKLQSLLPSDLNASEAEYNDDNHLISDRTKVTENIKDRISQVWFYWGVLDWSDKLDEFKNFGQLTIRVDTSSESTNAYGDKRIKKIFSRWHTSSALVSQTCSRLLNRYSKNQFDVSFEMDAKDANLWTGDHFNLRTRYIQDTSGASPTQRMQVSSVSENIPGTQFKYDAVSVFFSGRYAFAAPNSISGVTYSTATEDQKNKYCFIAPDSGVFSDGTDGYKII